MGKMAFNWTQQTSLVKYTLLIPNVVDLDQYRAALGDLIEVVQGLATGMPPWFNSGPGCNSPIPALNECGPLCSLSSPVQHSSRAKHWCFAEGFIRLLHGSSELCRAMTACCQACSERSFMLMSMHAK